MLRKFEVPRPVVVESILVETMFGDDTAALEVMLLKKESYPM